MTQPLLPDSPAPGPKPEARTPAAAVPRDTDCCGSVSSKCHRGRNALVLLALMLAMGWFFYRGPLLVRTNAIDFATIYSASKIWASGGNPYDYAELAAALRRSGYQSESLPHKSDLPSVYPPSLFPLAAPLTTLSFPAANIIWLGINLILLGVLAWALADLAQLPRQLWPTGLLLALLLACAPIQRGVALGQLSLASMTVSALSIRAALKRRDGPAGLWAGLAVALKPHIGVWALLYLLLRWRWRSGLAAAALLGVAFIAGAGWLSVNHVPWVADLSRNLQAYSHGGVGDPTSANPSNYQLVNLHYPLHHWIADRQIVEVAVIGVLAGAGFLSWLAVPRASERERERELLLASVLAVVTLLGVNHRIYDGVLMAMPLAWVFHRLRQRRCDLMAWLSAVFLLAWLLPTVGVLWRLADAGRVPATVTDSWLWRCAIMPHVVWAACALLACLVWALWETAPVQDTGTSPSPAA